MKNLSNLFKGAKNYIATRTAKGTFLSLLFATCATFTACTDEVENISQQNRATLQLNVGVNQPTSRAIVEGKTLPNTAQIGVSVVDATGTAYQQQNYNNVLYTAAEVEGKQTWSTTANVTLSGEEATLYAYYPYAEGADITAILMDMTETDQKDWMYATPVTGLSDGKSTAEVKLNHALTDLRLTFYKENYSGKGEVTDFTIQSTGLATGGTLDAKTGEITLPATPVNTITRTAAFTLTDKASATPIDVMLIPTGTEAPVNVSVTVDGHTYSASTTAFTLQKAKAYNYVMKLTSTGLEVTSVALTDWNEENLGDAIFESEKPTDPYEGWMKLTYNETDNSSATQIFYYSFDVANVAEMAVLENTGSRAVNEPQAVTPALTYQFSTIGEHTVYVKFADMTKIPEYAFMDCSELIEVTIPHSVHTIGGSSFLYCSGLTEVTIGNSVQTIEGWAFSGTGLTEITIPNSVQTIEEGAFLTTALTEVTIGSGVTRIGNGVFKASSLDIIRILTTKNINWDNVLSYGFGDILSIKVIIPANAFEYDWNFDFSYGIGNYEYDGLFSSSTLYMDTEYGEISLDNCVKLTCETNNPDERVKIFNNNYDEYKELEWGYAPFDFSLYNIDGVLIAENGIIPDKGLIEITPAYTRYIPSVGVSSIYIRFNDKSKISSFAFYGCSKYKSVTIPECVNTIEDFAFDGCSGLTEVTIPNSVKTIERCAFSGCSGLTEVTIPNSVQTIEEMAFVGCSGLTEVTIPNSVTEIGRAAFSGTGLTEVTIPNSVKTIGCISFASEGLTVIKVEEGNTVYDSRGNCNAIMETATNTLIQGCKNTVIPDNTEIIGREAFEGCTEMTSLTIPNSVKTIGEEAFVDCRKLTSITIPESVTTIGNYAFNGCSGLNKITSLATTAPTIESNMFSDVKEGGILYVPQGCKDAYNAWMRTGYLGRKNWTIQEITE